MIKGLNDEESLVKYTSPILLGSRTDVDAVKAEKKKNPELALFAQDITSDRTVAMQDVLDCILPPRLWEENGLMWKQQVSAQPATRNDMLNLGEQLDMKLVQMEAKETGICSIRRELFKQAFDEIIRQVTVNCAERGLLLLKIRDEMRMTGKSYQSLYVSTIAYGIRKALKADYNKRMLELEMEDLKKQKEELKTSLLDLKAQYDMFDRRAAELRQTEEKKHKEELEKLKATNLELRAQLESIIAPKKNIDLTNK